MGEGNPCAIGDSRRGASHPPTNALGSGSGLGYGLTLGLGLGEVDGLPTLWSERLRTHAPPRMATTAIATMVRAGRLVMTGIVGNHLPGNAQAGRCRERAVRPRMSTK